MKFVEQHRRRVIVESPYSGNIGANVAYALDCVRDCLLRGESPMASHLLYTRSGILNDDDPEERKLGMEAGWAWMIVAHACVVYEDRGTSNGMKAGIGRAKALGVPVEYRRLHT